MAVTSSGDGNFSSVITGGLSVNDDVIINHDVTLDGDAPNVNSLTINSGKTITGGGNTITIDGEGTSSSGTEHYAVHNSGIISGDLNLIITYNAETAVRLNGSSGNFNDITINHASADVNTDTAATIDGNLNITLGEFDIGNNGLTVAGTTTIGPNSGAADQATMKCNASTVSLGSGITSSAYGLYVNQGGTFTGGSGTHTLGSVVVRNNAAAKCTLTSGVTTINGEHGGEEYAINIEGSNSVFAHGSGTVTLTRASDTRIRNAGADLALNNLIINHASAVYTLASNGLTCAGDFTITAGEFSTGVDKALTVGGGIKNTGTLTANASTIIITGELAGFALNQMGTFNAGTSTIQIGDGSTSTVGSNGTNFKTNNCHNLIINQHLDAPNGDVQWRAYTGTEITIGGNLTVTKGKFRPSVSTQDLTVTGDVDIAANGQIGTEAESGAMSFGSLSVASGGTYSATSGTTTITNKNGVGFAVQNSGTFTHNKGTIQNNLNDTSLSFGSSSVYNWIVNAASTVHDGDLTVNNNLTINSGKTLRPDNNSRVFTVHNITTIAGTFGHTNNTGTHKLNQVNVTGTLQIGTNQTIDLTGLRNISGTVT